MIDYVGDGLACKIKNIYCLTFYREALLTGPWGKLPGSRNEAREVQGEAVLLVLTWPFLWGSAEQWGQELLLFGVLLLVLCPNMPHDGPNQAFRTWKSLPSVNSNRSTGPCVETTSAAH